MKYEDTSSCDKIHWMLKMELYGQGWEMETAPASDFPNNHRA